jgi:hypothetical protein
LEDFMAWWRRFAWWWFWPRYRIAVGTSFATPQEAARSAELQIRGGEAIGIASAAICCDLEGGGTGSQQWAVFVLIKT